MQHATFSNHRYCPLPQGIERSISVDTYRWIGHVPSVSRVLWGWWGQVGPISHDSCPVAINCALLKLPLLSFCISPKPYYGMLERTVRKLTLRVITLAKCEFIFSRPLLFFQILVNITAVGDQSTWLLFDVENQSTKCAELLGATLYHQQNNKFNIKVILRYFCLCDYILICQCEGRACLLINLVFFSY